MKIDEGILQDMERDRQAQEGNGDNKQTRFMIAGEAPVLLGKACELLIKEMSARAWRHTERNRRRTLQRQDVHAAVGESEVYDFLIDIVPRITTNQAPPQVPFPEQHMAQVPQAAMPMPAAVGVPPPAPEMGDPERFALQMHQMAHGAEPQVHTTGYEQYYMQMHQAQARMQAEAGAAPQPQMAQPTYMTAPDPAQMAQWAGPQAPGPPPPQVQTETEAAAHQGGTV